jgi:hypothetical protein
MAQTRRLCERSAMVSDITTGVMQRNAHPLVVMPGVSVTLRIARASQFARHLGRTSAFRGPYAHSSRLRRKTMFWSPSTVDKAYVLYPPS